MGNATLFADRITAALHTTRLGRHLEVFDTLPSTNTYIKEHLSLPHGAAVVAVNQTAGRGRRGRTFFSPDGGLYLSVLIRRHLTAEAVGLLTSAAAVAVARAIEDLTPVKVQIKWVNDLLIRGKKVCGILAEGAPADGWAIIGIGVNVSTDTFPRELEAVATSLTKESGKTVSAAALAAAILNALEPLTDTVDDGAFLEEVRRRSAVIGRDITVYRGGEVFPAHAVSIDDAGGLIITTTRGTETLTSGEVSIRL